jgi:hypothetical protein
MNHEQEAEEEADQKQDQGQEQNHGGTDTLCIGLERGFRPKS